MEISRHSGVPAFRKRFLTGAGREWGVNYKEAFVRIVDFVLTLAFTLTRYNADRLDWLYQFADEQGALGINVHPLCDFGAASTNLSDAIPDSIEFQAAAWLLAVLVDRRGLDGPVVTLDVVRRNYIEQSCWPLLREGNGHLRSAPFADLVLSLVVEPDGCITPFIYGFPRSWSLGFIDAQPLTVAIERWRTCCASPVSAILRSALVRLAGLNAEYFDLFGEMLSSALIDAR